MRVNVKMWLVVLLCLGVVACVPTAEGAVSTETVVEPPDQTALETLALRLIPIYGPDGRMDSQNAKLLPGEIPDDLDLPLPAETAVIGSFLDGYGSTQVVLDINLPAEDIAMFYENELPKLGWEPAPQPRHGGGFAPASMGQTYCHEEQKESFWLSTMTLDEGISSVHISINPDQAYSSCDPAAYGSAPMGANALLPTLEVPTHARQTTGGSGGGDEEANSYATLKGELDLQETITYFSKQLEEQKWSFVSDSQTDSIIITFWTFQDEDGQAWYGTLSAFQWLNDLETMSVHLEILQAPE